MIVLGIDPGIIGGWAVVDNGKLVSAGELPVAGEGAQRMVSAPLMRALIPQFRPDQAVVERVGAMPKQGVSSTFRFGRAVGIVEGVIGGASIPVLHVQPAVWKRHFGLGPDKEAARQRAIETWPEMADLLFSRKKDHGAAEAALIALWGFRAAKQAGAA